MHRMLGDDKVGIAVEPATHRDEAFMGTQEFVRFAVQSVEFGAIYRFDQSFLGRKMAIERPDPDPGGPRDGLQRNGVDRSRKQGSRAHDDPRAILRCIGALANGR